MNQWKKILYICEFIERDLTKLILQKFFVRSLAEENISHYYHPLISYLEVSDNVLHILSHQSM